MKPVLPAILAGVSLLLAAGTAYELLMPPETVDVPRLSAPRRDPQPVRLETMTPFSEDRYASIDARPLFSAARAPLPDNSQPGGGASAAGTDFSLAGVIMSSQRSVALIRIKSSNTSVSATLGALVSGWRVAQIAADSITLRSGGGEIVVHLDDPASQSAGAPLSVMRPPSAPTPPPAAMAPAAPPVSAAAKPPVQAAKAASAIAPEALKGAPRDPTTGEPTL